MDAQDKKKNANEGITREQADEILDELRQIRQLLEKQAENQAPGAPAGPAKARLHLEGAPMLGSKDAPVTMVEFTDYQCPFCQRFHMQVYGELKKDFIDTGKVRFYQPRSADRFAAPERDPRGAGGAMRGRSGAVLATARRDGLASRGARSGEPGERCVVLQMDEDAFRTCVESGKYKEAVQGDLLEAMKIGADGTPAFVVGKSTPDGVDGEMIVAPSRIRYSRRSSSSWE